MWQKLRRKRFLMPLIICGVTFLIICLTNHWNHHAEYFEEPIVQAAGAAALSANMERVRVSDVIALNEFISGSTAPTTNFDYAYNGRLSDKIGAYRALPDTRDEACRARYYYLPHSQRLKVSVIIAFHNEARSTLMRTIMAVYRRTPSKYLHELILLDDHSSDASLLSTLRHLTVPPFARTFHFTNATARQLNKSEGFLKNMPDGDDDYGDGDGDGFESSADDKNQRNDSDFVVIKMQRNSRRLGLIESRNRGARLATGDYLFFLDSHCEVNVGWLEPLLERMVHAGNTAIAVSPVLDSIDAKTLQYRASSQQLMGGFDWNLHFHWVRRDRRSAAATATTAEVSPTSFRSPVTAGGVFLISRKEFYKLNGFNTLLKIWGGESIEFSIKLWLCGGQIEIVQCSRVGHIFRKEHSFQFPDGVNGQATYLRNSKIIAESWLDGYKYFFYALKPAARNLKLNISKNELELFKHKRKCKTFAWYLKNVFPELKLPNDDFIAFGKLSTAERCLHILKPHQVLLSQKSAISSSPAFELATSKPHVRLQMANCYHTDVTRWYLHRHNGHLHSSSGACLNVIRISMPSMPYESMSISMSPSPSPSQSKSQSQSQSPPLPSLSPLSASSSTTFLNQTLYFDAVTATHFIVVLQYCRQTTKAQRWLRRGGQLIHEQTHLCLDNPLNDVVAVSHCRHEAPSQLFHFTMEMQQLWQL